jgi:peptide deformylase
MSDILTINTQDNVVVTKKTEPLPLYGEDLSLLDDEIPEYTDSLPNPMMSELINRLKVTMKLYGGLGLSANQCGVYERVFVIGYGDESFACINPKVINSSTEIIRDKEGCLSYPGIFMSVPRSKWVDVEFTTESGEVKQMHFEGITARCFLHELDHMNGIKYTKHVGPVAIRLAKQKAAKTIKKYQRQFKNKNALYF